MRRVAIIIVCAASMLILGGVTAILLLNDRSGSTGRALIGGPFELVDHAGKAVNDKSWPGQRLLVFFGYASCPDVCPTELQTVAVALDALGDDAAGVQPLFITIDPERDTPAAMADYVTAFHPRIVGLTGTDEQIRAAAKVYRAYFAKGKVDADGEYFMDHSSFVYLMHPDGHYLTHFGPNTDPKVMAEKIAEHL
jgi:cytochrome oxidase Cu insertion factor (SCO1/SenC/PrrC family)